MRGQARASSDTLQIRNVQKICSGSCDMTGVDIVEHLLPHDAESVVSLSQLKDVCPTSSIAVWLLV